MVEIIKAANMPKVQKPKLGRPPKYPWRELKPGEGFFMPRKIKAHANTHCAAAGKSCGAVFTAHEHAKDGVPGVLIIRTE